jgi:DNA-binding NarL/FixJ family response regulator
VSEEGRVRVLIVDDHPMVREVVAMGCSRRPSLEVVGQAGDGIEALEQCECLRPDVVVLDLGLPGMDGFKVLARIRDRFPATKVMILSGRDDRSAVFESVRLGAHGYLVKTGLVAEIASAVEAVARGTEVFSVHQQQALHAELGDRIRRARRSASLLGELTRREREVLRHLVMGLNTRTTADRLGISQRTVEAHLRGLYRKLGVRNRVQAVRQAADLGLVDVAEPPGEDEDSAATWSLS